MINKNIIGFGIAGNFANHLEQAHEANDFVNIKVDDIEAPKGIFPFYLPNNDDFLGVYPLSSDTLMYPKNIKEGNLQMEPEVALICELIYDDALVVDIKFKQFSAYNDCSIRRKNAKKISQKKNWGQSTKGISLSLIDIDKFENGGIMDSYNIASFLIRDNKIYDYGEDSSVLTYKYFYTKLKKWIIYKINTQKDEGVLENLSNHLKQSKYPKDMIISIGATRYTEFGKNNFLHKEDDIYVIIYDTKSHTYQYIKKEISKNNINIKNASILHQKVI